MPLNLSFSPTPDVAVDNKHRSSPSHIGQEGTENDFHWHYLYQHCKLKIARHPQYIAPLQNKILLHGTTAILLSSVLLLPSISSETLEDDLMFTPLFAPIGCFD
mmetsp:Transcript_3411/g.5248  ORF Transcript_3411/g.5248 Transcript_3411/m.5248 type:complete len:104 (-) Transcript_3411:61-372(-)